MATSKWAVAAQIITVIAGIAGTVITPLYGTQLATAIQSVLQALSGLLVLVPTIAFHITTHKITVLREQARLFPSQGGKA